MIKEIDSKNNWRAIILFYALACLWSWPFLWWRDLHPESWKSLEIPTFLKTWLYMWGPGLSALVCFLIFRKTHIRKMTFSGTDLKRGLLFYTIFPISIAIVHLNFSYLKFGLLGFIAICGEELGWRGFLQDALHIKSKVVKAIVIGILWEAWHFTAHTSQGTLLNVFIRVSIFIIVLIFVSYLIIYLTEQTNSIFIPVTIHMAINAAFEFQKGWMAILFCLPIWFLIYRNWIQSLPKLQRFDENS